jgi:GT2 family glycosyltransferase
MGCVVIASNRGGMAEMIEHGKSGFLINPQNPQEIADVILEHHQDLGRLGRISAAAQTRSRELADPERARARILDNYSQPLPARRWLQPAAKKVSVIIPFNHPSQHLAEAIQSVRNSGYRTLEIIVVNRGPADRLANELPEKIEGVVQVRKEDGGLSSARNAGIRAATGDYLMMLDADEEIHADYIATAVQALENNPDLAYVTCHAQRIGASDRACIPPGFVPALMPFLNTDGTRANVYRREAFAAGGGYDEIMVLYEDWDFLLTLHQRGLHGEVLPAEFVFYREQLNSKPGDATCALRAELIQRLLLKYSGGGQKDGRITAAVLAGLWKQEEIRAEMLEHRYAESQDALSQATEGAGPPGWWQRCFEKTLGRKLRRSIRKRLTAARSCFDDQVSG